MSPGAEAGVLAQHRPVVEFAHEILPTSRFRGVATAVTRGVLARAYYSAPANELRHFADVLQSGIASSERDQPITMLLRFLIDSASGRRGRPEVRERYGKSQRALAAYLAGESLSRLYAPTTELFPFRQDRAAIAAA
jgi:hypothetical protein